LDQYRIPGPTGISQISLSVSMVSSYLAMHSTPNIMWIGGDVSMKWGRMQDAIHVEFGISSYYFDDADLVKSS
jgi:hypothetical protein